MQIAVGHANPDFDAYASTVAATKLFPGAKGVFLGSQNAAVRAFHNLHSEFLDFVELKGLDLSAIERLVMVDTKDPRRIGELSSVASDPNVEVVIYDHHPRADGDLVGADDRSLDVGATTSILVHEIRRRGISLTPLETSLFLLGIHEDTGSLVYPSSTAYDAEAVAYLMANGADTEVLTQFLVRALDPQQRELLASLTDSLQVWEINGQPVAVGVAQTEEYVDSAAVLTHHIVEDMGYRVAVAAVQMPDRLQIVARSRSHEVDVGAAMKMLGGGGHSQAASAGLRGVSIDMALEMIRDALEAVVRPPLLARDIMSSPVRTITEDHTMADAGALMARWGHGGLPIVDNGQLVGLVTRKDFDKAHRHGLDHAPVTGFMAREVRTVTPQADLGRLEELLARAGIGRVPVVGDGELIGIVTRKDLLRAEHGNDYLDRAVAEARTSTTKTFMSSFESLLPDDVRRYVRDLGILAQEMGVGVHLVGGFVRDMLLGRKNLDMDIVVEGDGVAFAQAAAERSGVRVKIHRRFGTAVLVISSQLHIDVTSARTEYYTRPGALPTVERSSLRQDLFRRDFSINAMAVRINPDGFGTVADPFAGIRDLERDTLRVLHSLSFVEDPTRVLRAARFEGRYGFVLDSSTEELARRAVEMNLLAEVSGARIREEILDIIDEDAPDEIIARLDELGAFAYVTYDSADAVAIIDSLRASAHAFRILAEKFSRSPRRRVTLIAAMASGASRGQAEKWLRHLRFGKEYSAPAICVAEKGSGLTKALSDGRKMKDSRLYRMLEVVPDEAVVCLWALGNDIAKERITRFLDVLCRIRAEVSGEDLIGLGMSPSSDFSDILSQAFDDRLDGKAVGRQAELANLERIASRLS